MQEKHTTKKRLLFFVAEDWYFVLHFLQFAVAAQKAGWEVALICNTGQKGPQQVQLIRDAGVRIFALPLERTGFTPLADLRVLLNVGKIVRNWRPDVIHAVALKPILFGHIVSSVRRIPLLAMITGLGYVFTSSHLKASVARPLVGKLLSLVGQSRLARFAVLNGEDADWLVNYFAVESAKISVIPGTGVDLNRFKPGRPDSEVFTIAYIGRMLKDKGIFELIEAVRTLKKGALQFRLVLAGAPDPSNPESINEQQLQQWQAEGICQYLGHVSKVEDLLQTVHAVILPSYREGLGMSLLEAAAAGLPCIATDVPGCRSAVIHDETGLLVKPRDAAAIAAAVERLVLDDILCRRLGNRAREMVGEKFSQPIVVGKMLQLYDFLHTLT